jgi:pimeloyl-ACP methyl ester carboxylesterase
VDAVRRLPRGRLVTFEACGHFPHLEYPDDFNRVVTEFLQTPA